MVDNHFTRPRFERRYIQQSAAQTFADIYGIKLVTIAENGQETAIDLNKLGYTVTQFIDNGFSMDWINEELDDLDGTIDLGSSLSPRSLQLNLVFSSHDRQQDALKVHTLRKIFSNRSLFWLRTVPESERQIQVRRTGMLSISQPDGGYLREASVTLSAPSPYWESIKPAFQPLEIGNGLAANIVDLSHAQTDTILAGSTEGIFWNEGDAVIDPRSVHTPLKMIVSGGIGTDEPFTIENKTTGTSVQLEGLMPSQAVKVITFDGIRVHTGTVGNLSNSLFSKSSRSVLTLAAGVNEVSLSGGLDTTSVQFVTKYYYH